MKTAAIVVLVVVALILSYKLGLSSRIQLASWVAGAREPAADT